jgi:adenosylcobinamide-phosphate synthase
MSNIEILLIALVLDALIGDPDWLWRKVPHPVAIMGKAIAVLDRRLNKGNHKILKGGLALAGLLFVTMTISVVLAKLPDFGVVEVILTTVLLAQNSLARHIGAVADGLENSLSEGQKAVASIVSRDPKSLDETAVARSAIESAAENFSDALVAPAFWAMLFGLPGIMVYKMINTDDSMIGYRNTKYADFGWAAARLDDLVNWIPARISGLLICVAYGSVRAFKTMRRDAPLHRSPNAGWPEAAAAAALGVAISGPRMYDGVMTDDPFVNSEGRRELDANDIKGAIRVIWRGWGLLFLLLVIFEVLS